MKLVSHARLLDLLLYDGQTGDFYWKRSQGTARKGNRAGYLKRSDGYWRITIDKVTYLAHRLAWFYTYSIWPQDQLDHMDADKQNNRIANIRPSNHTLNQHNAHRRRDNKSGKSGVCWVRSQQKWRAYIRVNGKYIHLGVFANKQDAIMKRLAAERIYQPYRIIKA